MNILSDGLILYNNAFAAPSSKDKTMNAKPIIIGVAGGSGSGKTTVSRALYERFSGHPITIIEQDYYYNDQAHLSPEVRRAQNYDHPDAFDNALLYRQLDQLLKREAVELPQYDYTRDTRAGHTKHQPPVDVIILEGILALYDENIRSLMDIKLFVDTDADLRFIRRLQRDCLERGPPSNRWWGNISSKCGRCTSNLWSRPSATPTLLSRLTSATAWPWIF